VIHSSDKQLECHLPGDLIYMSELLKKLASHIRKSENPDIHIVSGQNWSDGETSLRESEPKVRQARIVDPSEKIDGVSVGNSEPGKLTYFMDGIERMHVPVFFSMVPVVYGYVAAAIRFRGDDKKMRKHAHEQQEAIYFPYKFVDPSVFANAGISTVDTGTGEKPLEEHPIMIREAARLAMSKARGRLESGLVKKWLLDFEEKPEWLLVDGSLGGTLGGDYKKYENPNIIGAIKSHQTQYFEMEDQRKILSLGVGERSGVFMPLGREQRSPVYSWYLRIRPNDGQDLYFGLMRIEAAASDRTLEMVDEISRWLLAERSPLSLPDSRWDKMIYPIRDCEQYLKSIAPTKTMLESSMMGLGTLRVK